ncbi:hypothetical protein CLF_110931 [Clonorchis sinensis]|uniref:Uncharacterized protein n=1 Tax=Clonorchis sinensis TaxID=79923 RepID=G7YLA4_CLOSI|nr:hypothetical protein CLF_110931 [Clonorchis sinensis]
MKEFFHEPAREKTKPILHVPRFFRTIGFRQRLSKGTVGGDFSNFHSQMEDPNFPHIPIERTLAIIKPEAIRFSDEIEEKILQNQFFIIQWTNKCLSTGKGKRRDELAKANWAGEFSEGEILSTNEPAALDSLRRKLFSIYELSGTSFCVTPPCDKYAIFTTDDKYLCRNTPDKLHTNEQVGSLVQYKQCRLVPVKRNYRTLRKTQFNLTDKLLPT